MKNSKKPQPVETQIWGNCSSNNYLNQRGVYLMEYLLGTDIATIVTRLEKLNYTRTGNGFKEITWPSLAQITWYYLNGAKVYRGNKYK